MISSLVGLDPRIVGGVDTHKDFNVAVAVNMIGHVQGTARLQRGPRELCIVG